MHPLGRAFQHLHLPTSVRLQGGLSPCQSLGKRGLETRTSGHSFLSLLLKYTHSQQAFVAAESVLGSPFVSLRTLGSGKTKGHTSVSVKCLLSLQLTHSLCKALNGASSHEWDSYHTYFSTALLPFFTCLKPGKGSALLITFGNTLLIAELNCALAHFQTLPFTFLGHLSVVWTFL